MIEGTITGTCGHILGTEDGEDGMGWFVHTIDGHEECWQTVCTECKELYRQWGILVEGDDD